MRQSGSIESDPMHFPFLRPVYRTLRIPLVFRQRPWREARSGTPSATFLGLQGFPLAPGPLSSFSGAGKHSAPATCSCECRCWRTMSGWPCPFCSRPSSCLAQGWRCRGLRAADPCVAPGPCPGAPERLHGFFCPTASLLTDPGALSFQSALHRSEL